jgi:hypothetical protein
MENQTLLSTQEKSFKLAVMVQEESELWIYVIDNHYISVEMHCS